MQMSIESFLLINFSLDILILFIVSKGAGSVKFSRILLTSSLCTGLALITFLFPDTWYSPVVQLICLIPLSMAITGTTDIRRWWSSLTMLITAIFLSGGFVRLFETKLGKTLSAVSASVCGIFLLFILLMHRRRIRTDWNIELCISVNGVTCRFTALIDTGNRLHEPLSGLPVIIAERHILKRILPETGYRNVAFGGLGGNGTLKCFRPDGIWIISHEKLKRAPDAWIAVSPSSLPGMNRALAPCEFASL